VDYNGSMYPARLVSFTPINLSPLAAVQSDDSLLVIVLLCVLIPLGVAAIVIAVVVAVVCWRKVGCFDPLLV